MQPVDRRDSCLQLLLRPTASDPYTQNPLLESSVALDGARRLLDKYGDAVGERFAALPLLPLTPALANHPANLVANLLCKSTQSKSLGCERLL